MDRLKGKRDKRLFSLCQAVAISQRLFRAEREKKEREVLLINVVAEIQTAAVKSLLGDVSSITSAYFLYVLAHFRDSFVSYTSFANMFCRRCTADNNKSKLSFHGRFLQCL